MHRNTCTFLLSQPKESITSTPSLSVVYGTWLNTFNWHYYCTFTTRYQLSKSAARRMIPNLQNQLHKQYLTKPTIFWVAEPFDTKYGCHLHALIQLNGNTPATIIHIKNAWQVVSKGKGLKEYNNTTIKPYDPLKGGHFYVAKYLHLYNADYDLA